jgi:hypothetical protein
MSRDLPKSQLPSFMHIRLTGPETETVALTYKVYPLTERAGLLNQTDRSVRTGVSASETAAESSVANGVSVYPDSWEPSGVAVELSAPTA